MARLTLEWPLDLDGYYIDKKQRIIAKSGRAPIIRDVLRIDALIRRLVELPNGKTRPATAEGALDFVQTFGFLQNRNGPDHVRGVVARIRLARDLVKSIDREDWASVQRWAEQNASVIRLKPTFTYREAEDLKDMFFEPINLTDAIFCQALDDAAAGTEFVRCDNPGCPDTETQPKWFRLGPGTGRSRVERERRYCSQTCGKAHRYQRLKKGELK